MGLKHESKGEGMDRYIVVYKPPQIEQEISDEDEETKEET